MHLLRLLLVLITIERLQGKDTAKDTLTGFAEGLVWAFMIVIGLFFYVHYFVDRS